jgi:hypothetical protein
MSASSFRNQIVETQKVRSDLMKWKLVLVAGIGTVGLGIQRGDLHDPVVVLMLIPLVCIYVDALCAHLSLRIQAIGAFTAEYPARTGDHEGRFAKDYEGFNDELRTQRGLRLESLALHWSTAFASVLSLGLGLLLMSSGSQAPSLQNLSLAALVVSGILGLTCTILISVFHKSRSNHIRAEAKKFVNNLDDAG